MFQRPDTGECACAFCHVPLCRTQAAGLLALCQKQKALWHMTEVIIWKKKGHIRWAHKSTVSALLMLYFDYMLSNYLSWILQKSVKGTLRSLI